MATSFPGCFPVLDPGLVCRVPVGLPAGILVLLACTHVLVPRLGVSTESLALTYISFLGFPGPRSLNSLFEELRLRIYPPSCLPDGPIKLKFFPIELAFSLQPGVRQRHVRVVRRCLSMLRGAVLWWKESAFGGGPRCASDFIRSPCRQVLGLCSASLPDLSPGDNSCCAESPMRLGSQGWGCLTRCMGALQNDGGSY